MIRTWRARVTAALSACLAFAGVGDGAALHAQQGVVVETGEGVVLSTVSPRFTIRTQGFDNAPLRITMRVSENFGVLPPFLVDTTYFVQTAVSTLNIRRALPSGATVYWRALVEQGARAAISETTGPRVVPIWVQLLEPASALGDPLDTRQPLFRWRSPDVDSPPGPWRYELEILASGQSVFGAANITDTIYRLPSPLQANTRYSWRLTASLPGSSQRVTVQSPATFLIEDPALPTSTLVYQNFPNPFPSAVAFSTCFWFDVGEPGARISLEILDLRGNPVRTIVPAEDGQSLFPPGRYGRGIPGSANNCDNRFVWNGTARDGQPVPPGVYLARFRANGGAPTVRRILFRGR